MKSEQWFPPGAGGLAGGTGGNLGNGGKVHLDRDWLHGYMHLSELIELFT